MNIYGEKIVLRAIEQEDNQMLLELINDPETEMQIGGYSWPASMENQIKWFSQLNNNELILRCTIAETVSNKPLGTLILNEIDKKNGTAHIHIKMAKGDTRGKGYGTDAVNTAVKYAFSELRLNCIYANILTYNTASIRLIEKCGFKKDGTLRSRIFKQGKYFDLYTYSIILSDWTHNVFSVERKELVMNENGDVDCGKRNR